MKSTAIPDTHERFIKIEGSVNLRDFGGYPTEDGKTVKRGLLFRCGNLNGIPKKSWDEFADLDIGVICDLRSQEEAKTMPSPQGGPFECRVHIPIWPGSSNQFQEAAQDVPPTADDFNEFMHLVTREIARDHVDAYKQTVRELVKTERGFLLHCSQGKDRTGFGAAIILTLLGVSHDIIMHDYLVSNEAAELVERTRENMQKVAEEQGFIGEMDDSIIQAMAGVRKESLLGAFEEIDEHYGGIHGYFEAIGISQSDEEHLRERLLE
ncbi:MAG: tyrosine-protein phosphatase [Gammaproteobacteria bacterium]|jgi:protein-tyrosine phosphatase|nr:tyrosine-protein phosphatase [Gammaproteobacteria bacterium]MBT7372010.1 tyrosine-protein phosphatase [Gammaproteobacteria bacterium]